jgi:heme/copper-type cytochrome/quinol oxidase subunit 2
MEGIIDLHNSISFYLLLIFIFVIYIMGSILWDFVPQIQRKVPLEISVVELRKAMFEARNVSSHTSLEIFWTLVPFCVLILIGIPSFSLLYKMDEVLYPLCTIKVIGHQWYWTYQYSNETLFFTYDSNLIYENELNLGDQRLLKTDAPLYVPVYLPTRVLVTSTDVIHSFALPNFGLKIDAIPGRLNQLFLNPIREGIFFGQCSELCGAGHSQMPIELHAYAKLETLLRLEKNTFSS